MNSYIHLYIHCIYIYIFGRPARQLEGKSPLRGQHLDVALREGVATQSAISERNGGAFKAPSRGAGTGRRDEQAPAHGGRSGRSRCLSFLKQSKRQRIAAEDAPRCVSCSRSSFSSCFPTSLTAPMIRSVICLRLSFDVLH